MLIEPLLMLIPMIIIAALLWTHAEKIYQSHAQSKRKTPYFFKITGFNEKYVDRPELWVKRFRIQLLLFAALFSCMFIILALRLWLHFANKRELLQQLTTRCRRTGLTVPNVHDIL